VTVVLALCALTFGLIEGDGLGWTSTTVLAALAITLLSGGIFIWWEQRTPEPMLPLRLFANRTFSAASAIGFAMNLAFYGIVFLLSLFLQNQRGYSALETGLMFLPMTATIAVANLLGGRLTNRFGSRLPMALGQTTFAAGLIALGVAGSDAPIWWIWLAMLPTGIGGGITVPAMTSAVLETVRPASAGIASGALNAARQVGGAVGVALFGTLVAGNFLTGLRLSLIIAATALLLGALTAIRWAPGRARVAAA
jgi:DHA2 family methylenomycin A resistance protein-like MFS transporter